MKSLKDLSNEDWLLVLSEREVREERKEMIREYPVLVEYSKDLVASKSSISDSVASHSCTKSNSIEQ